MIFTKNIVVLIVAGLVLTACQNQQPSPPSTLPTPSKVILQETLLPILETPQPTLLPTQTPTIPNTPENLVTFQTISIPAGCAWSNTTTVNMYFYWCGLENKSPGLWLIMPFTDPVPMLITPHIFGQGTIAISPDKNYLAVRTERTKISIYKTQNWELVTEIETTDFPDFKQYEWLPTNDGLIVTYLSEEFPLGVVYLTGEREVIVSKEQFNNSEKTYYHGGIEFLGYRQDNLIYKLYDVNQRPPTYWETYVYDVNTKENRLIYKTYQDDNPVHIRHIFNFVNEEELIVSIASTENPNKISGYYRLNLLNQELTPIILNEDVSEFSFVPRNFFNNSISIVNAAGVHKLINLENGEEIQTGIECSDYLTTEWSSQNDFVLVICQSDVWLFDLQTKEATQIYDQPIKTSTMITYVWDFPEKQVFVIDMSNEQVNQALLLSVPKE